MNDQKVMGWREWTVVFVGLGIALTVAAIVSQDVREFFTSQVPAGWVQALGSVAAILVAVAVANNQVKSARAQALEAERREMFNILQAIRDEIETLWEGFQKTFGYRFADSNPDEVFNFIWPSPEDPFVVYHASAGKIGHIDNHELRRTIVRLYARAEGMLVTVRTHNARLLAVRAARRAWEDTQTDLNKTRLADAETEAKAYANIMRGLYEDIDKLVEDAKRLLPSQATDASPAP